MIRRLSRILFTLIAVLSVVAISVTAQEDDITLEPLRSEDFGYESLLPEGWSQVAPGSYVRGASLLDNTTLVQQAVTGLGQDAVLQGLLPNLALTSAPDPVDEITTAVLTWTVYKVDVNVMGMTIVVDLAFAEWDNTTYLILLQTNPNDYESLHESVFLPVVDAFRPLVDQPERAVYNDPDGLFSVPLPTNWTAAQEDGYGTLRSPEDEVLVYVLALAGDDVEALINDAWRIVDPEFDLTYSANNVQDFSDPDLIGDDLERVMVITYADGTGEDGAVIQGVGQLYDGMTYIMLFDTTLVAAQRRGAQINVINTGYEISAIERADVSGIDPLPIDDAIIAELEAFIAEAMDVLDVPGASIAIVQGGEMVYSNGFGVKDYDSEDPVNADTLMMIGSTTKPMTTTVMAMLVDDGLMAWDTLVVDILPQFAVKDPELTEVFTVRNLVCACTGVPRRDLELIFNTMELDAETIIASLADFEFFTDFGEAFQYSNQLVAAGGFIAAAAAGSPYGDLGRGYEELMQTRLFDVLDMPRTFLEFDAAIADDNYALPYGLHLDEATLYRAIPVDYERFVEPIAPAGAIWSTVEDMAKYIILQLERGVFDGAPLVSEQNLVMTWEPQVEIGANTSYGLGWIVDEYRGVPVIHHGGNTLGFTSDLAFLPEHGIGIIVLTNQQGSSLNAIARTRLFELVFDQETRLLGGLNASMAQVRDQVNALTANIQSLPSADELERYTGAFYNEALGDVILSVDDAGNFVMDAGEFVAELRYFANEETGRSGFTTIAAPLIGLEIVFAETDADVAQSFTAGSGVAQYAFDRID